MQNLDNIEVSLNESVKLQMGDKILQAYNDTEMAKLENLKLVIIPNNSNAYDYSYNLSKYIGRLGLIYHTAITYMELTGLLMTHKLKVKSTE